jgi:hypothetical protein
VRALLVALIGSPAPGPYRPRAGRAPVRVPSGRALLSALSLALSLAPGLASAQDVRVVSTEAHGETTDLVVEGDLALLAAAITDQAPAQIRAAAPQVYEPLDLGVVRYSDTTTRIQSVTFHRVSDTELGVTVRAQVRATQEHRTLSLSWARDGVVHVATVTLEARVTITFTESGGVHAVVVGDSVSVHPELTGLSAIPESAIPLSGRTLGEQTIQRNVLASRHLRPTALRIESVEGNTLRAHVTAVAIAPG